MLRVYIDRVLVREDASVKATDPIHVDAGRFILGCSIPTGREVSRTTIRRGRRILRVDIFTSEE